MSKSTIVPVNLVPSARQKRPLMTDVLQLIRIGRSAALTGDLSAYRDATRLVAKTIRNLSQTGRIDDALNLEAVWYQNLVKQIESEDNYFEAFRWHKDALFSAGMQQRRAPRGSEPKSIAFIVPNGVLLGHTQVTLKILRDWKKQQLPAKVIVISLTDFSPELSEPLRELSTQIFWAGNRTPSGAIAWCRDTLNNLRCETAVWVSVPIWASYALGMELAPRQVFWSLKFHPVHLGNGIKHVAMTAPGDGEILIHGNSWFRFSPPLSINSRARSLEEKKNLKVAFGNAFIFGSLARTEKFNSPNFVNAAATIVGRCMGSKFVYTGAEDSKLVRKIFEQHGLSNSAIYVGWVDTELYSQAIDVFLETFPFGCGITGAQAVDRGTKTVSLWRKETLPHYYFERYEEAVSACRHWAVVNEEVDYVQAAVNFFHDQNCADQIRREEGLLSCIDSAKSEKFHQLIFAD